MFGLSNRAIVTVLAAAAAAYAYVGTRFACAIEGTRYYCLTDEQLISMRYARNLAEGHGLVWNAGEAPVEGFTNLLWTLWMAVGHLLPLPETHVSLWVVASSALCLLGSALLAAALAHRLLPDSPVAPLIALLLSALYFPLMHWSLTGFEVGALALLYTAALVGIARLGDDRASTCDRLLLGLWFSLAILVRMDSAVSVTSLSLLLLWVHRGWKERVRLALHTWLPTLAVILLLVLWRLDYYGELFPNTMVLKMGGVSAAEKLSRGWQAWLVTLETHLLVVLVPVILGLFRADASARVRTAIGVGFVGQWLYMLSIGGDTWEAPYSLNRQLSVAAPSLFALTAVGLVTFRDRIAATLPRRIWADGCCAVLTGLVLWSLDAPTAKDWIFRDPCKITLFRKVELGLYLRDHAPPDTRVAVVWAGAVPYFSRLPAIDLLGKSDKVIARSPARGPQPGHNKWDYAYSIERLKPDVIASLWKPDAADLARLRALGYRQGKFGAWYHEDLVLRDP